MCLDLKMQGIIRLESDLFDSDIALAFPAEEGPSCSLLKNGYWSPPRISTGIRRVIFTGSPSQGSHTLQQDLIKSVNGKIFWKPFTHGVSTNC